MTDFVLINDSDCDPIQNTPNTTVNIQYEIVNATDGHHQINLNILTTIKTTQELRRPLDICFAIDISQSMNTNNKLNLIKKSLNALINVLNSEDRISIVTYNHDSNILVEKCYATRIGVQKLKLALDKIVCQGTTNLSAAIKQAVKLLAKGKDTYNYSPCIMLMTDGYSNQGIIDSDLLLKYTTSLVAKFNRDIIINTFGYGPDHHYDKLEKISNYTGGNYYYIPNLQEIHEQFADAIGITTSVIGREARLQLPAHPNICYCHQKSNTPLELVIDTLVAGYSRDILTNLTIISESDIPKVLNLTAKLVYQDTNRDQVVRDIDMEINIPQLINSPKNPKIISHHIRCKLINILKNNIKQNKEKLDKLETQIRQLDMEDKHELLEELVQIKNIVIGATTSSVNRCAELRFTQNCLSRQRGLRCYRNNITKALVNNVNCSYENENNGQTKKKLNLIIPAITSDNNIPYKYPTPIKRVGKNN